MTTPFKENIKTQPRPPTWNGAVMYTYANYLASSTDVIATDFFDEPEFIFAERDLMWCNLSDGYFTLRFINTTTAVIAID